CHRGRSLGDDGDGRGRRPASGCRGLAGDSSGRRGAKLIALDVIWPRLIAIADEMATTLFRTAFSHDVIEVHDMSTGLYDDRGNLIAQTWLRATAHAA